MERGQAGFEILLPQQFSHLASKFIKPPASCRNFYWRTVRVRQRESVALREAFPVPDCGHAPATGTCHNAIWPVAAKEVGEWHKRRRDCDGRQSNRFAVGSPCARLFQPDREDLFRSK